MLGHTSTCLRASNGSERRHEQLAVRQGTACGRAVGRHGNSWLFGRHGNSWLFGRAVVRTTFGRAHRQGRGSQGITIRAACITVVLLLITLIALWATVPAALVLAVGSTLPPGLGQAGAERWLSHTLKIP